MALVTLAQRAVAGRALSESRRLRFATFALLYAAQGIPDAMVLILFPAYLAAKGASAAAIGAFLATAMIPNAAKLLAGPMIDRVAFLPMGRRKPWLMLGQAGIAASFAFLATLTDPVAQLVLFTAGAFAITLATAFQDVATDATAMDVIPPEEQGRANGIMWGAKTLGIAGAASTGALILAQYGFMAMVLAAMAVLLLVLGLVASIRERPDERLLPWMRGKAAAFERGDRTESLAVVFRLLIEAMRKPAAQRLVGLSLAIGLLVGMTGALAPVLMVKQFGWVQQDYAQFRSSLKLASGLAAMLVGGYAIDRFGHRFVLTTTLGTIAVASFALAFLLSASTAAYFLTAYEILLVFTFVTFFAATMKQCTRAIAATQFSFIMVCGNLTMAAGAALLGPLIELGGPSAVLVAVALVALIGVGMVARLRVAEIIPAALPA